MNKITLVKIKNPFSLDREIQQINYNGQSLKELVNQAYLPLPNTKFTTSINGDVIKDEEYGTTKLYPGDYIVVCPVVGKSGGGKKVFAAIASIALMVGSIGIGNLAQTGTWSLKAAGMAQWGTGAYLAAGAFQILGGSLISHMMPTPKIDVPNFGNSQTYGWGKMQSLQGEGNVIPVTFGTVKTAGQILAQHITTDGDKQYLNILLCGGEGPIDSITDIRINDNPISNYNDVQVDVRLGANDQLPIANFGDIFADQFLNYELNLPSSWSTHKTEGNAGQGLEITIELPNGLYYANDQGGLSEATVHIQAQYKKEGETEWKPIKDGYWKTYWYNPVTNERMDTLPNLGSWTGNGPWVEKKEYVSADYFVITAAQNNALRKVYRADNLPIGRYEVRCQCIYKSGEGTRYGNKVVWSGLSHIIYDDFARPGKVLVGIKALATDQLNGGVPNITWLQTRNNVWVDIPGQGCQERSARNPAWACYDLIHRCKKLKNINIGLEEFVVKGASSNSIIYSDFSRWAQWCDEKKLQIELILDAPTTLWDALAKLSVVGRGMVITKGTRYSCICDRSSSPVQLFNVSNIEENSFQEEFLPLKDRANAVEITFFNKEKNYQRDFVTVYADGWNDNQFVENKTQITLYGITSYEQAYREGEYRLNLNKHILRSVSFGADIDAIACQVGNVILVQNDVTQWGDGGRIVSATTNTVTLSKPVNMIAGKQYSIMIRLSNDVIIEKSVINKSGETDNITVSTDFSNIPQQWDVFSFGEIKKVAKPFKVLRIGRSKDLKRKISAIEYNEAVYNEAENIPIINYSYGDSEVLNLSIEEVKIKQHDGSYVIALRGCWQLPALYPEEILVYLQDGDSTEWNLAQALKPPDTVVDIISRLIKGKTYRIKVCSKNVDGVVTRGVVSSYTTIEGDIEAPDVRNLILMQHLRNVQNGVNLYELEAKWDVQHIKNYSHADVYVKSSNPNWEEIDKNWCDLTSATFNDMSDADAWKYYGKAYNSLIITGCITGTTYTIKVIANTTEGKHGIFKYAPQIAHTVKVKSYIPTVPQDFKIMINNKIRLTWSLNPENDVDFYEIRLDGHPGLDTGRIGRTSSDSFTANLASRIGNIYLYAHNPSAGYSHPVMVSYSKEQPNTPRNVTVTPVFQGLLIKFDPIPSDCLSANIYINGQVFNTVNNEYIYKATGGIFDIQVAYVDIFGEGAKSTSVSATIIPKIDQSLLAAEAVSLEKVDQVIKDAVKKAQNSLNTDVVMNMIQQVQKNLDAAESRLNNAKVSIDTFNTQINILTKADQDNIAVLQKSIDDTTKLLDSAKVSVVDFNATVNVLTQADNSNTSAIQQVAGEITTVVSKLNDDNNLGNYKALSYLKQRADSIGQTVTDLNGNISNIQQTINSIQTAISNQAGQISSLQQTASNIQSTVQSNKTAQDGVNQSLQSSINQNAGQITSIIKDVDKNKTDISAVDQKADSISQVVSNQRGQINQLQQTASESSSTIQSNTQNITNLQQTASNIQSTVQSNKTAQDGVNQSLQSSINQNAGQITSIITELNKPNPSYTSITQLKDAVNLRAVKTDVDTALINKADKGSLISQINVCPEAITLDSKLIHIKGDTLIDDNVIVGRMLAAESITADKIKAGSIKADNIEANSIILGKIALNALNNNTVLVKGIIDCYGTIPLPDGYTQDQCIYGVTVKPPSNASPNSAWEELNYETRKVVAMYDNNGFYRTCQAYYWILGVR